MDALPDLILQGQSSGLLQFNVTPVATLQHETYSNRLVSTIYDNQVYVVF